MNIFKTSFAALVLVAAGGISSFALDSAPVLAVKDRIGKVVVDGTEMTFLMGEVYDPNNKYDDDEPDFTSVRKTSVYDDRGTFLAAVEVLEKQCQSEPAPMNVDMEKFKKLKVDWLKNPLTASNYRKASKEFDTIPIKAADDLTANDSEWRGICDHVNEYVMELKIFKHLPDTEWSKYEASTPAWMNDGGLGAYPYVDQIKFTAHKVAQLAFYCSSATKLNEDKWRLIRAARVGFTAGNANTEQMKDYEHYATLIRQAAQRIEWKQTREGDIVRLAQVCREYQALVSNVNSSSSPAANLPMDRVVNLYLVGIALQDVKCPAGTAVVRNALDFARQNGKAEVDIRTFAAMNNTNQLKILAADVDRSRNTGAIAGTLKVMCEVAMSSSRFLGLPNPQ
jgi:hypothetical protein